MGGGQSSEQPQQIAVTPARSGTLGASQSASACFSPTAHSPGASWDASMLRPGAPPPTPAGQPQSAGFDQRGNGQWQYTGEDDGTGSGSSVWHDFGDSANERIEAAFKDGKPSVEVAIGRRMFVLEFALCKMKISASASASAAPRGVRRVVLDSPAPARERDAAAEDEAGDPSASPSRALFGEASTGVDGDFVHTGENGRHIVLNTKLAAGSPAAVELVSTARAHNSLVYCAAFDHEGKHIITGGRDGTLRMWEFDTGFVNRNYDPVSAVVLHVAMAPGKSLIATGADDKRARLYNLTSGQPVAELEGHEHKVYATEFTSDSKQLFTGSMDNTNRLWDVRTQECLHTFKAHTSSVFSLTCSRFSPHLAISGGDDNKLYAFDLRTRTASAAYSGHSATIWATDISFDETQFVSAGMDGRCLLWDPRKPGEPVAIVGTHNKSPVHDVEFVGDGNRVLSCGRDATWRLWDVARAHEQGMVEDEAGTNMICRVNAHDGVVFAATYNAVRGQVLSIGSDAYVRLWDARL